ncbi:MAG: hypothetical protein HYV26_03510 [Candidatus Hydrogenedentes bacterium]|nr:hypothetical protein [Candidatus Hydrogenedentota bacterium]
MRRISNSEPNSMKICAFYSRGPHYVRVLRGLRERYPEARITALVPPEFPHAPIAALVDNIEHHECAMYGLHCWPALLRLVRQVRAGRYDLFVLMFDSTRLRAVAAVSGAPERYCYTLDGRSLPLDEWLVGQCLKVFWRNLCGRMTYARVRCSVACRKV